MSHDIIDLGYQNVLQKRNDYSDYKCFVEVSNKSIRFAFL